MEKSDLLKKYLDQAYHNLLCCSQNYGMSIPKPGYENEWNEYRQEVDLLKEMTQEVKKKTSAELIQQRHNLDESDFDYLKQSADRSFSSSFGIVGFQGINDKDIDNL